MLFRLRANFLFAFLFVFSVSFSQQKWPGTFLWRISGNGLQKPSYLYGTIHLQDKRLFQFSDSLYQALEKAEGFALEIDFTELMDSIFSRSIRSAEDDFWEKEQVKLDKKKLDKSADSILETLGIKGDHITKKDLKKIRDYRMNRLVQQGEMQTIVDGYLYGLALRQGKWMGGIEDVVDQLDLVDELGAGLTPDEVFQPEVKLRNSLDEIIKIYIDHNLQSLADYVDSKYNVKYKDELLIHRNVKMARRMDSLSALRAMFFAVGAAHLPGDSGVISLLRSRGFTVEPVFSPQSLSPEAYASKLNTIPWKTIDGDGFYSIQMPGTPSEYNVFGEVMKMKIFFDLPTMTFYMAGHTLAANSLDDADKAFAAMAGRMGAANTKIKPKDITLGGIKGKENIFDAADGTYKVVLLRKNNTLYLLMAGSSKKSNLASADVNRFFSSFMAKEVLANENRWTDFKIPGKGFTIKLPGSPRPNKQIDEAKTEEWKLTTYDLVDNVKGFYYLFQVRDIGAGYYVPGDSVYFDSYKKDISKGFEKLLGEEQFTYKGWPAHKMELLLNSNVKYTVYNVLRGNRVYLLAAGGGSNADFADVERAFNSLEFEEYDTAGWKNYLSDGFSTTAPEPLKAIKDTSAIEKKSLHFISYDTTQAVSYEVFKLPLSKYYWIDNDSLFFEKELLQNKNYNDSIVEKRFTCNGRLKGIEFATQKTGSNLLRKIRFFVNADTLYELVSHLPKQYADKDNLERFFNDFRVKNEVLPSIYARKPRQLLEALRSKDTTEFEKALTAFKQVNFTKEDLPLLHQALLEDYIKREEDYYTVNENIIDALTDLADSSTVQFISENYPRLHGEKDSVKYFLLEALAKIKTAASYAVLKDLLLAGLPSKGNAANLAYPLRDSLELTLQLYPNVLSLSGDTVFSKVLVDVTKELLDSSLISMKVVLPYRKNFLGNAKRNLEFIREDEKNWWAYRNRVPFIGRFNDKESNELLNEFLKVKEIDAKYAAVLALLKNNQSVSPADIEKVAEDKGYRKDLYDEFKKLNKLKLYPSKYATQLKIAESEIYFLASDDAEPSSVRFVGERTALFEGRKQKFYLFQVSFDEDDTSSSYLGIAGPYSVAGKEIITSSDAAGVFWEETYDKQKVDEQLKKHLSETEEYLKEKEPPETK